MPVTPRRILLVSGSIGAGHDAAADALAERAAALWPDARIVRADTLAGMGRHTGTAFAGIYAGCVRRLPWLYALYFHLLEHVGFFRAGTRAVIGAWSARSLGPLLDEHRPDLVVATFPEGITGLAWLRRRGRLPVPAVAALSDPAPHALWCDPVLDLHLVASEAAAARARRVAPGAVVRVGAPPVATAFRPPPDRAPAPRPRVYVACGSLALGDVPALCAGVLDAGADVLVSCGRSAAVRRRLERLARTHPRGACLDVRDWVDDPAATTRDADVVVVSAAGATAFEALACARPLLVADPIPGHGRANAEVLAAAGLALVCDGADALRDAVADLADPTRRAAVTDRLRAWTAGHDLAADVAALAALAPAPGPAPGRPAAAGRRDGERVRAEDALFLHAASPRVPQQLGARIVVDDPAERADWPAYLAGLVRERAPGIEVLSRRLAPHRRGRPWRWTRVTEPGPHVRPELLVPGPGGMDAATAGFFADPVDPATLGWELQAVRSAPGEVTVLAKVHHALGDGLAVTDALCRLILDEATAPSLARAARDEATHGGRARAAVRAARGAAALAAAGPAGPSPVTGRRSGPTHRRLALVWDGAQVRSAARTHGVPTTVLVLALVAESLADPSVTPSGPGREHRRRRGRTEVRATVPTTERLRRGREARAPGNRTAAVSVRLPVGPMPLPRRVAAVARALESARARGQAEGSAAVLAALAALPRPVQRAFVRTVYGRRSFHLLASVLPGVRRPTHCRGERVRTVLPVIPLAEGVGLAVGVLGWGETLAVGITVDDDLVADPAGWADRLDRALAVATGTPGTDTTPATDTIPTNDTMVETGTATGTATRGRPR